MAREYVATEKGYGYQGRYWRVGEIATVNDGDPEPPRYFELVKPNKQKPIAITEPIAEPEAIPVPDGPPIHEPEKKTPGRKKKT